MSTKRKVNGQTYRQRKKQKKMENLLEEYNALTGLAISVSDTSLAKNTIPSESSSDHACSQEVNNSFSDNCEKESPTDKNSMVQELQRWIVGTQTPQVHSDKLLQIMRENTSLNLPKCTKTFLKSDVKFNIEPMEVTDGTIGEFYHFGIKNKLQDTES